MQSQLKNDVGQPGIWRALGLTLSASALTLALFTVPTKARGVTLRTTPLPTDADRRAIAELAPAVQPSRLAGSAEPAALEALFATVEQGEPQLSSAALEGIAQIGGERAREFLARQFHAAADAQLPALASALATLGDAPARAVLLAAARSPRFATRAAAFDALATLDTADVREFMLQALSFVEPGPAASYFSNCREPRALPGLERLARSGDAEQRRVAIDALFAQGVSAEDAIARLLREDDELCDALLQAQPSTAAGRRALRRAAIARLRAGALTSGSVFEFLQQDLSSEAREALVQAARDPASRDSALSALSARGDRASLQALSTLANDSDQGLAARAACALLSEPDSRSRAFITRLNRESLQAETAAAMQRINAPGGHAI